MKKTFFLTLLVLAVLLAGCAPKSVIQQLLDSGRTAEAQELCVLAQAVVLEQGPHTDTYYEAFDVWMECIDLGML
jgi:hypothetical protein